MDETTRLSANQSRALEALMTNPTIEQAAEAADLSVRTIYNYLDDPAFSDELFNRQSHLMKVMHQYLIAGTKKALETVHRLMDDPNATEATQLRASIAWLELMGESYERRTLERRLDKLEELEGHR